MNKLWTKDFTIISLGTVVSMLGNSVAGFAISLMVLDFTNSTFLYALFLVMYSLPKIAVPLFAGPFLDRFSRKKTIYLLDFLSAALYLGAGLLISSGWFHYGLFLFAVLLVGTIDGVYIVAYDSLYPNLVSPGNFSKAYAISSMIYPLAAFMVPVASFAYNRFGGAAPLFFFNAASFFIAACFETQIGHVETHLKTAERAEKLQKASPFRRYRQDFREGLAYLRDEKGLLTITAYFFFCFIASSGFSTLSMPFFRDNPALFAQYPLDSVTLYTLISGFGVLGRLIGGFIHYRFRYPTEKKFAIALLVYACISVLEGVQLYLPILPMAAASFSVGILGVTSYNIRISATQAYVPDDKRARFNGVFEMVVTVGSVIGQLVVGALAERLPIRPIVLCFNLANLFAVVLIMYRGRNSVKAIYNRAL